MCGGLLASLAGIFWYGGSRAESTPEAFLSSPLVHALHQKDRLAFAREVERLPSIDAQDREGMTVLLTVACCGDLDDLKYVLSKSPDVNRGHSVRGTPLMAFISRGDVAATQLLLQRGADVTRVTRWGDTALLTAVRFNSAECVDLILNAVPPAERQTRLFPPNIVENPLNCAASDEAGEPILRRLLAAGFDPNRAGCNGQLPLITAHLYRSPRCAAALLASGANPDLPDSQGRIARGVAKHGTPLASAYLPGSAALNVPTVR